MSHLRVPVGPDDHVRGPPDAILTIVEYGDYQCPFCGLAYPELEQVRQVLGPQLRFVYRHFPLAEVHPYAMPAAEAAEAAGAERRFWAMHDLLFQNQDALDVRSLLGYAASIGLDVELVAHDLQEHRHVEKIKRDFLGGVRSGVNGTPNLFFNGIQYHGPVDAQAILQALRGDGAALVY